MRQATHQAAFTPSRVILVYDAFFCGFIQCADGCQGGCPGVFRGAFLDGLAGVLDVGPCSTGEKPVAQASFMVLFDALDC